MSGLSLRFQVAGTTISAINRLNSQNDSRVKSSAPHPFINLVCNRRSKQYNVSLFCSVKIKMESTRKLSNFNFLQTKTSFQNNLKNIAFFFTFFNGNRCNYRCDQLSVISRIVKTRGKLRKFHYARWHFVKLTFIFWGSHKKFSLVLLHITNYIILQPLKNVKRNALFFKLFWYKVFDHRKLK